MPRFAQMKFKNLVFIRKTHIIILKKDCLKTLSQFFSKTEAERKFYFQIVLQELVRDGGTGVFIHCNTIFREKTGSRRRTKSNRIKWSQEIYKGKLRVAYLAQDRITAERKLNLIVYSRL